MSTVSQRFNNSILKHPYRTALGVVLWASFMLLLCSPALPFALHALFSPAAAWLQSLMLVGGTGIEVTLANMGLALLGSLVALASPKLVGNALQFIGKRLIADITGALSTIPYLLVRRLGNLLERCLPARSKNEKDWNIVRNIFVYPGLGIKNLFLGLAWGVTELGKVINTMGIFLSGEYAYKKKKGKLAAVVSKPDAENQEPKKKDANCCTSTAAFMRRKIALVKRVHNKPENAEQTSKRDEAIIWPQKRRLAAGLWVGVMDLLGDVTPLKTYDTMRKEEADQDPNRKIFRKT